MVGPEVLGWRGWGRQIRARGGRLSSLCGRGAGVVSVGTSWRQTDMLGCGEVGGGQIPCSWRWGWAPCAGERTKGGPLHGAS